MDMTGLLEEIADELNASPVGGEFDFSVEGHCLVLREILYVPDRDDLVYGRTIRLDRVS